jgi:hypothetical protein
VDTFECARFHGDALPEGISEENVMAVRSLLAQDYAASFQVNHDQKYLEDGNPQVHKLETGTPLWKLIVDYSNSQNIFLLLKNTEHDFFQLWSFRHF